MSKERCGDVDETGLCRRDMGHRGRHRDGGREWENDMDLRDSFAMAALTGLLANGWDLDYETEIVRERAVRRAAGKAYEIADAMLKARNGKDAK